MKDSLTRLKICCNPDVSINDWYANLKMAAGTSSRQEMENTIDRYNRAIRPLTKIKDYEKWVTEWELAIQHAQNRDIGATLSSVK